MSFYFYFKTMSWKSKKIFFKLGNKRIRSTSLPGLTELMSSPASSPPRRSRKRRQSFHQAMTTPTKMLYDRTIVGAVVNALYDVLQFSSGTPTLLFLLAVLLSTILAARTRLSPPPSSRNGCLQSQGATRSAPLSKTTASLRPTLVDQDARRRSGTSSSRRQSRRSARVASAFGF